MPRRIGGVWGSRFDTVRVMAGYRCLRRVAVAAVGAVVLAGCSGGADTASGARDLSAGGICSGGEDITVNTPESAPVITGECGNVTASANAVRGNIESAATVTITGTGTTLLGQNWGTLTVEGAQSGANIDRVDRITIAGDNTRITAKDLGSVTVDGNGGTVNADGIGTLIVNGDGVTVIVSGTIDRFEVHGNNNTFNWDGGAAKPTTDTGTGNTYTR